MLKNNELTVDINLPNRYNNTISLSYISDNHVLLDCTDATYISIIGNGDSENQQINSVDPEGGPMISVGDSIGDKKIKSIKTVYLLELE